MNQCRLCPATTGLLCALEYYKLEPYRAKYGLSSDHDPELVIDPEIETILLRSSSWNPKKPEEIDQKYFEWFRDRALGIYETRRVVALCVDCMKRL